MKSKEDLKKEYTDKGYNFFDLSGFTDEESAYIIFGDEEEWKIVKEEKDLGKTKEEMRLSGLKRLNERIQLCRSKGSS